MDTKRPSNQQLIDTARQMREQARETVARAKAALEHAKAYQRRIVDRDGRFIRLT
jgi:hypothetical protein